jgi:hypothetical protein
VLFSRGCLQKCLQLNIPCLRTKHQMLVNAVGYVKVVSAVFKRLWRGDFFYKKGWGSKRLSYITHNPTEWESNEIWDEINLFPFTGMLKCCIIYRVFLRNSWLALYEREI